MYLKCFYVCQLASLIVVQLFHFFFFLKESTILCWWIKVFICTSQWSMPLFLGGGKHVQPTFVKQLQIFMLVSVKILISLSLERKFEIKQIQLVTCIQHVVNIFLTNLEVDVFNSLYAIHVFLQPSLIENGGQR